MGEAISGIAVDYRRSPIVEEHGAGAGMAGPAAGERAPDAPLSKADGAASLRLHDLFAEHRHVLLLLGNPTSAMPAPLPHGLDSHLAVHRISAPESPGGSLIDCEGIVARRYGSVPAVYLIRPDGYVGFRCEWNAAATHLPRYLARVFQAAS